MKYYPSKFGRQFNWFLLFWAGALILALYLAFSWQIEKYFLGIVERGTHVITAEESGRIQTLLVQPGDQVTQNQLLAVLNFSDLKQSLENMRTELNRLQNMEKALLASDALQVQRLYLRLGNETTDLLRRMADIESKSAELASVNALIQRLEAAQEAGLGYNRELADLYIRRDGLVAYLEQLRTQTPAQKTQNEILNELNKSIQAVDINDLSQALYLDRLRDMDELQREIIAIEQRINARNLIAPCDGYITNIYAGVGDVIKAFDPLMTVEIAHPTHLIVYIPEKSTLPLKIGAPVKIYSSRSKKHTTIGTISFIHPGFTQANERISFRGQIFWARMVQVDLPPDHQLIPGEMVKVKINGRSNQLSKLSGKTRAADLPNRPSLPLKIEPKAIKPMAVPIALRRFTSLEPSGIVWIPSLGKFLLVSDDTGQKDTKTEHLPLLFAMDQDGQIDNNPVLIEGIKKINDIEGITAGEKDVYYLISSQNISQKGKRPKSREYLIKLQRSGEKYVACAKIDLLSLILTHLKPNERAELGLLESAIDGKPLLNIEGIAYKSGELFLGLKQPVNREGAIIWQIKRPEELLTKQQLSPGQLVLYGRVSLSTQPERPAGISDLCFDAQGRLWVLSTVPSATPEEQKGGLHVIENFSSRNLKARLVAEFPNLKPEGLCFRNQSQLFIVFDCDQGNPGFCVLNPELL